MLVAKQLLQLVPLRSKNTVISQSFLTHAHTLCSNIITVDNEVFVTEVVWLLLYPEYVTFWAERAKTGNTFVFTG